MKQAYLIMLTQVNDREQILVLDLLAAKVQENFYQKAHPQD